MKLFPIPESAVIKLAEQTGVDSAAQKTLDDAREIRCRGGQVRFFLNDKGEIGVQEGVAFISTEERMTPETPEALRLAQTPRVDALVQRHTDETHALDNRWPDGDFVDRHEWREHAERQAQELLDFARTLERELNALHAQAETLREENERLKAENALLYKYSDNAEERAVKAEAALAAARKDQERYEESMQIYKAASLDNALTIRLALRRGDNLLSSAAVVDMAALGISLLGRKGVMLKCEDQINKLFDAALKESP
jgi:regulator of replication initiation timing